MVGCSASSSALEARPPRPCPEKLPALAVVAVVPTALVALIFAVVGIHPRNLRRMGWSLVASNLAVLAGLIIGLG